MHQLVRIVVADDDPAMRLFYEQTLSRLGHQVHIAHHGPQLVALCQARKPDLIIADVKMSGLDGITAVAAVSREHEVPAILVSAYDDPGLLRRAWAWPVMAYLVKPVKAADLNVTISLALVRFKQLQQLRQEAADLRQTLEDRKLIEQAKGLLLRWTDLDEPAVHRRLQQAASIQNRKLVEVAREVLEATQVFTALDALGG